VVGIVLQGTPITDEDLENLTTFPQLRRLDLSNTAITDVGLINLLELTQLQSLKLTGTRVTDRGIRNLQRALPNLQITR
jgi:Leucine-rich repeat (LRR) protein